MTLAIEIPKINLNGFKIVGKNYGIFKSAVFYTFNKIKNVDILSFRIILDNDYETLSKDNNSVFFQEKAIQFANPKTFKTLENGYTKDDKYVFKKGGEIIKKADPKTFQVLTYTYQRDKKNVFIPGEITEIDVKSFKILECNNQGRKQKSLYATDKNYAYFQGKIIPNADVKTFYLIESDAPYQTYAIDKNKVYYSGKKLKDADPTTFKLNTNKTSSNYYDAKDKNYTYIRDKKTITKNK